MSTAAEFRDTGERLRRYRARVQDLLNRHRITTLSSLKRAAKSDPLFRAEWQLIWQDIAASEGGKLSLASAGTILGAVFGGLGLAAFGGAIGVPLALIFGAAGLLAGTELDVLRRFKGQQRVQLGIPRELYERIQATAKASEADPQTLIVAALESAFPEQLSSLVKTPVA